MLFKKSQSVGDGNLFNYSIKYLQYSKKKNALLPTLNQIY